MISFGCFILSHQSYIEKKNDNYDHRQLPLQGLHVPCARSPWGQLGKGRCNPLLAFQLEVLWYQDFTGTFINESLHYYNNNVFSRTVSHIPRMCFTEIHVKTNITMKGKKTHLRRQENCKWLLVFNHDHHFIWLIWNFSGNSLDQVMIKQMCHKA